MTRKRAALLLALILLMLSACASTGAEVSGQPEPSGTVSQPEPTGTPETAPSDPPETQTEPVETAQLVRFESQLGCSVAYDPALFTAEDHEDEYYKRITTFTVESVWEDDGFPLIVFVEPLDASSVEDAVNVECLRNLDEPHEVGVVNKPFREEVTFGAGDYPAVRLPYNEIYAVGEIYVTEQNGAVYKVEVSSYYQPPEDLLAQAYAILDSITF